MAQFNFRHGIARRQADDNGNPANLLVSNGGAYIDLIVSPDPTTFIIAHKDVDYLLTENKTVAKAWGPFTTGTDYWLYWDVDFLTGELTRGFTTREPRIQPNPVQSPLADQHWFDSRPMEMVMKVWTGSSWIEKLRVFVARYQNGATLIHYPLGTQIGVTNVRINAGTILYDPDNRPVQQFQRNQRGKFVTTETPLHSQFARLAPVKLEAAMIMAEAQEHIPINHAVTFFDYDKVGLARNTVPTKPAVGIAVEDMHVEEVRRFVTRGFVTDDVNWDWSHVPAGTPLFVGVTGELVPDPPIAPSVQQIGIVVNKNTIYVDVQQLVDYSGIGNLVPLTIDRDTGVIVASNALGNVPPQGFKKVWGFAYCQTGETTQWIINHNLGSDKAQVQVFDLDRMTVLPDEITIVNVNTIQIDFNSPQAGCAYITLFV